MGKTGIVEGFAQLLEDGKLPKELGRPAVRRVDILSTMPMGGEKDTACAARLSLFIGRWARRPRSVKAGTKYRGEFEERVEALVREASQEPKPILFIDDLPSSDLDGFHHLYLHIVDSGYTQNPSPEAPPGPKRRGRRKQSKARNLLDRFRDHPESILAFMYDFDVPFDNNLSERDLRMEKLRQNISGTFRSFAALVDFCRIRSYISTARKNGLTALEALRRIYQGNPFLPT
ncbi:MAG: transposase, partial [Verrucomicrobia bacterium]|nr:transposase [Verrucomicrobiota bacterium]